MAHLGAELLATVESLRQQHDALVAEVTALRLQGQNFERRIADLEDRGDKSGKQRLETKEVVDAAPQATADAPSTGLPQNVLAGATEEVPQDTVVTAVPLESPQVLPPAAARLDTPHIVMDAVASQPAVVAPQPTVGTPQPVAVAQPVAVSVAPSADSVSETCDTWAITMERLEMYESAFRKADSNGDGIVEPLEVREVLDRSGLPPEEMKAIFLLVDVTKRLRLNFAEFACAMFIAFQRAKKGVTLPSALPPELKTLALSAVTTSRDAAGFLQPALAAAAGAAGGGAAGYSQQERPKERSPTDELQERLKAMEDQAARAPPAAAASSAIPVFFETDSATVDPFDQAMSIKDLKARLKALGADFTGLAEKSELLALLRQTEAARAQGPVPPMGNEQAGTVPAAVFPMPAVAPSPNQAATKPDGDPFAGLI